MSSTNGAGLPLRAALRYVKHKRRLVSRAAEANATAAVGEAQRPDDNEREEDSDDPTGPGGFAGGTCGRAGAA
jgi:hypothetical protein